jgi:N-acetyl-anhydromuramyl-L-alanine amidase AmpD
VKRKIIAGAAVLGAVAATGWGAATSWAGEDEPATVPGAFAAASEEFGVPQPLLMAYSYSLTGLRDHGSRPSASGGYGLMHLTLAEAVAPAGRDGDVPGREEGLRADPARNTLTRAAGLLGEKPQQVRDDPAENIRGGAALLADEAKQLGVTPAGLADWYPVVEKLDGSLAGDVFSTLRTGAGSGELRIAPVADLPEHATTKSAASTKSAATTKDASTSADEAECPAELGCSWLPAAYASNDDTDANSYGNYDPADRPKALPVKYIVVHDTESSYESTLNYFQDPLAYTSSHYVIRSSDGAVTQMVKTKDIAWHAGNSLINAESIGIEHEGMAAEGATWFTDAMYRSSASLVRYLAAKYDIPLDRQHILGHNDVANQKNFPNSHWDPGPFWDWDRYMNLLRDPGYATGDDLVTIAPGFATNQPQLTYCTDGCQTLPKQPSNTVLLHSGPGDETPLITDPVIGGGTDDITDWSDKAVAGRRYAVAERSGDWTAIWYGGQKAWLHSDVLKPAGGKLVRPRDGVQVPVFPANLPDAAEWPEGTPAGSPAAPPAPAPVYTISGDQAYELADESPATYYYARFDGAGVPHNHTVITGATTYYRISFHHRFMYVRASDVDKV